jgi:hypothetical protein
MQKFFELFFIPSLAVRLDRYLMRKTKLHWLKKYGSVDPKDREMMFRSTETVSKTHPHNMQKLILTRYNDKLKEFDL